MLCRRRRRQVRIRTRPCGYCQGRMLIICHACVDTGLMLVAEQLAGGSQLSCFKKTTDRYARCCDGGA